MAEDLSPAARVKAALPGTLADLMVRTGYGPSVVIQQIGNLRREGVPVRAVMGERDLDATGNAGWEPTTYTLDPATERE